jgi:hypothetical protein
MIQKPLHGSRWHKETCASRDRIVALYQSGLSTRQIAKETDYSSTYIHKLCRGFTRSKSEAAKLRQPIQPSEHWRTARQQARRIWSETNGYIPEGYIIHHVDGDYTNNHTTNLRCMSEIEHLRLHHCGPEFNIPRHKRPARQAYMKEYLRRYRASKT